MPEKTSPASSPASGAASGAPGAAADLMRGHMGSAVRPRSEVQEACNTPESATLRGVTYQIQAFDINDLADFDAIVGGVDQFDITKFAHQRCVLWLALRKADPNLTHEERENGYYKLTEWQVGKMFTLRDYETEEVRTFIERVMVLSGIIPSADDPKNGAEDPQATGTEETPPASAT